MRSFRPFRKLETSLEALVEKPLNRVFRTSIQPVEIARQLEKEMLDRRLVGPNGTMVPNRYLVLISTADMSGYADSVDSVIEELEASLSEFAAGKRLVSNGDLFVTFSATDEKAPGFLQIESRFDRDEAVRIPARPEPVLDQTQRFSIYQGGGPDGDLALKVLEGPMEGISFSLTKRKTSIGRSIDGDIVLQSPDVSRNHAIIEYVDGVIRVIDLGSLNGTWVNGRQVHDWAMVRPGDIIQFGEVRASIDLGYAAYRPPWSVT